MATQSTDITLEEQEPAGKDDIYRAQWRYWRSVSLGFQICLATLAIEMVQKLLQLSFLDQLVQMVICQTIQFLKNFSQIARVQTYLVS